MFSPPPSQRGLQSGQSKCTLKNTGADPLSRHTSLRPECPHPGNQGRDCVWREGGVAGVACSPVSLRSWFFHVVFTVPLPLRRHQDSSVARDPMAPAQRILNEIHSCLLDLLSVLWLWGYINSGRSVQGVRATGPGFPLSSLGHLPGLKTAPRLCSYTRQPERGQIQPERGMETWASGQFSHWARVNI